MIIYDGIITFLFYVAAIGGVFAITAALADLWGAKVERDARRQARELTRAKRREEREQSRVEWQ